jgi:hypothetical protein
MTARVQLKKKSLVVSFMGLDLVPLQLPAGKNVSMDAEETVVIRHQATTGEDTAD